MLLALFARHSVCAHVHNGVCACQLAPVVCVCVAEFTPCSTQNAGLMEMAPETLWQAHAEQLHISSLADQAAIQLRWFNQTSNVNSC